MAGARRLASVVLALVVVVSVVSVGGLSTASAAAPSGMSGVPDGNVTEDLPSDVPASWPTAVDLRGGTMTDEHASTLEVEVTTLSRARGLSRAPGVAPELALELTDDANHEGRRVAVPRGALVDALGYVPSTAYGLHENGTEWSTPISVVGDSLVFRVPGFSTNTVTFSGTVELTGSPSTDGAAYSYQVDDKDAVKNFTIELTGATATEWDNESGSSVQAGSSYSISPAGNKQPTGPGANGEPTVTVTGHKSVGCLQCSGASTYTEIVWGHYSGTYYDTEYRFKDVPSSINNFTVHLDGNQPASAEAYVEIYVVEEDPDGIYGEGTKVVSNTTVKPSNVETGNFSFTFDSPYDVQNPGGNVTVEIVTLSSSPSSDSRAQASGENSPNSYSRAGTVKNRKIRTYVVSEPSNIDVSTGSTTTKTIGDLADGESQTVELDIQESDSSLSIGGSGTVDYTVKMKERTETVDPAVETNGNWANHTGSLADGSTTSLSTNTTWVQEGTNRVNVSVGDGTLSNDAPTPAVDLVYKHEAVSNQSVGYDGEKWSERYDVEKKYASKRTEASLTIPFAQTVTDVRDLEVRWNGSGGWSTVDSADYTFDGTELTVDLDAAYPSASYVPADTKAEVRANATKVVVNDGSISVDSPSTLGNDLNTTFTVDSAGSNFWIGVGGTADGGDVHYLTDTSWSEEEWNHHYSNGTHRITLPNAGSGDVATMHSLALEVSTSSGGDVRVHAVETGSTPELKVREGETSSDSVTFTWRDTVSGDKYVLYSNTQEVERDSAEASSPVDLVDDDSSETLEILHESSSSSSSSSGGGGGGAVAVAGATVGPLVLLGGVVVAMLALFYLARRFGLGGGLRGNVLTLGGAAVVALVALELATAETLVAQLFAVLVGDGAAGAVIVSLLVVFGTLAVHRRLFSLPRWLWIVEGVALGAWVLDAISGGVFTGALETVGPLIWLVLVGGGVFLMWRAIKPDRTVVKIPGGNR